MLETRGQHACRFEGLLRFDVSMEHQTHSVGPHGMKQNTLGAGQLDGSFGETWDLEQNDVRFGFVDLGARIAQHVGDLASLLVIFDEGVPVFA